MAENLETLVASSDLVIIGRTGTMTSTGGSVNAQIEVEEVLKGPPDCERVRIVFSTMGRASGLALEPGKRYIFFLQTLQAGAANVYSFAGDDPDTAIRFKRRIAQEIRTLVAGDEHAPGQER